MGKRKHHKDEAYLARKIRKLERKIVRIRRKHGSSSSSSEHDSISREDLQYEDAQDKGAHIEDPSNTSPHSEDLFNDVPKSVTESRIATDTPELASVVVPVAGPMPNNADAPAPGPLEPEGTQELDHDILCLLGEEPVKEEQFGPNVHKDIASRWSDILVNGLKDETKINLLKGYDIPDNLKLSQAPVLNPEIKAAVNEGTFKRDIILTEKQKILSIVITCIANTMTCILNNNASNEETKCYTLKPLSDAGRLLCHAHYGETQARRNFLLSCLNKEIKDSVKDLKRDNLLFGNELQDNLKSIKAISRTGAELKPNRPKLPPKNNNIQSKASTTRALNWRGPPPPQSQPRRIPATRNSTAGGRKQVPVRRATEHRTPRQHSRTARR